MFGDHEGLVLERIRNAREWVRAAHDDARECSVHKRDRRRNELIAADAEIAARARVLSDAGVELPTLWLRDRLRLTPNEERVMWVLIGHELCPIVRGLIRDLNTENVVDPTLDTVRRIIYGASPHRQAWRELDADGPLWRLGLVERTDAGEAPPYRQTLTISRRVLALVHGEVALDPEIARCATLELPEVSVAALQVGDTLTETLEYAVSWQAGLVLLQGPPGTGRRSLLTAIARGRKLSLLQIDGRAIASEREPAERQLRVIARECALFGEVPLVLHLDALAGVGDLPDRIDLVEQELSGLVLATTTRAIARRWRRPPVVFEMPRHTAAQIATVWSQALPDATPDDADMLAAIYPLAPALIRAVGDVARRQAGGQATRPEHIETGVRSVLDDRLAGLATRVTVTQQWEDLVLPEDQATAIGELLARIRARHRVYEEWGFGDKLGKGLGVAALFSGPPGTGKSMAAALVARVVGAELYQVDVSRLVSMWIGETEKHLAALFDAAEAGHAILLFDEADGLFGRRTDIRTSNDRHANQQTNYLLQRIESFAGICILTTNHDAAIDEAFRRRLSVHVRFPMPDLEERQRLWQALLPAAAPVEANLGLAELASAYVMSGGYIRNAVVRAAFLAAAAEASISRDHLARAAQLEYEAAGKLAPARMEARDARLR